MVQVRRREKPCIYVGDGDIGPTCRCPSLLCSCRHANVSKRSVQPSYVTCVQCTFRHRCSWPVGRCGMLASESGLQTGIYKIWTGQTRRRGNADDGPPPCPDRAAKTCVPVDITWDRRTTHTRKQHKGHKNCIKCFKRGRSRSQYIYAIQHQGTSPSQHPVIRNGGHQESGKEGVQGDGRSHGPGVEPRTTPRSSWPPNTSLRTTGHPRLCRAAVCH